jgi:rubredoxin
MSLYLRSPERRSQAGHTTWYSIQDVPDSWHCPECKILKAKKGVFKQIDE